MPKVTSKLQLTVPKAIADQYGIRPGNELQLLALAEFEKIDHERISLPSNGVSNPERVYDADPVNLSLLLQVF